MLKKFLKKLFCPINPDCQTCGGSGWLGGLNCPTCNGPQ